MTVLSAAQTNKLRYTQRKVNTYFSVFRPTTLLSALIANPSIARGDRTIAYDNGTLSAALFALIENGQPLIFNNKKIRIKSISGNQASGSIVVAENSEAWTDNAPITIEHRYPLFPIFPKFTVATSVFEKDIGATASGVTYTDENEQPPPVCIVGVHAFVNWYRGSNVVFNVDLSDSYAIANGASISSYAGTAAPSTGIAVSINAGTGIGTITCSAKGQWWVKFTVTDDNGKSQSSYRVVMTDDPFINFRVDKTISGSWDSGGWVSKVRIEGDIDTGIPLSDVPDEAVAVIWYENYYDGVEDYVNMWDSGSTYRGDNTLCAGYIDLDTSEDRLSTGTHRVVFDISTPETLLGKHTEWGAIQLKAKSAVTDWYEYSSWMTVGRAIHHLLKWHSTAFEMMDIWGLTDNTDGLKFAIFTEANLLARANNLAYNKGIFAKLVSDRLGRLHLQQDLQKLDDTTRAAVDEVFDLIEADVSSEISTIRDSELRTIQISMDGFTFNSTTLQDTPLLSLAPGSIPESEGTSQRRMSGQVLADQDDLNSRVGRELAIANTTLVNTTLVVRWGYDGVFDIASPYFYGWTLTDTNLVRRLSLNGLRTICRQVQHEFDEKTGKLLTSVVLEWEVEGPVGVTDTYPGFPQCATGTGGGTEPTKSDEDEDEESFPSVGLLVFSSVDGGELNDLLGGGSWTEFSAESTNHGAIDPWWIFKHETYATDFMEWWIAQDGGLQKRNGATAQIEDKTPGSNPANTWSDAVAPTAGTVVFIQAMCDPFESDANNNAYAYFLLEYEGDAGNWRGWITKTADNGSTYSYLPLYNGVLPTQVRPIWGAITANSILVTAWEEDGTNKLTLLVFDKSTYTFDQEVALGTADFADVFTNRTKFAFPVSPPDYDATEPSNIVPWIIAGRMDSPAGLSGIKHIIVKNETTWAALGLYDSTGSLEDWGSDVCEGLIVGPYSDDGREYRGVRLAADWTAMPLTVIKDSYTETSTAYVSLDDDNGIVAFAGEVGVESVAFHADLSASPPDFGADEDYGTEVGVENTRLYKISATRALAVYSNDSGAGSSEAVIFSLSGSTVTAGTNDNHGAEGSPIAAVLTTSLSLTLGGGRTNVYILDTTTNNVVTGNSAALTFTGDAICELSSTRALVVGALVGAEKSAVCTVAAGNVTPTVAARTFSIINNVAALIHIPSTTNALFVWWNGSNLRAEVLSTSGTTVTENTPVNIGSTQAVAVELCDFDGMTFGICWQNTDRDVFFQTVDISGVTVTDNSDVSEVISIDSGGGAQLNQVGVFGSKVFATFDEIADNKGKYTIISAGIDQFYQDFGILTYRSVSPLSGINIGGIAGIGRYTLLGSRVAGNQLMVSASEDDDFATWTDITSNLTSTINAIDSVPWSDEEDANGGGKDTGATGFANEKC